jgi:hypothetical protein
MTSLNKALRFLTVGLLAAGLSTVAFAQDKQADRQQNEATMTGCLSKDASGGFLLADEKTGTKMPVTGTADLEKHAANHKVTLTGMAKTDTSSGKSVFQVTKIQHVAAECKAPQQ